MLNSVRVCLGLEWLRHYRRRRKRGHIPMAPGVQGRDLLSVSERALSWLSRQHPFSLSGNLTKRRAERSGLDAQLKILAWPYRYQRSMKRLVHSSRGVDDTSAIVDSDGMFFDVRFANDMHKTTPPRNAGSHSQSRIHGYCGEYGGLTRVS